ncbi:MAG: 50S ribosomal protein L25 [Pirellulales bacterium]
MADTLEVKNRDTRGTKNARRQRDQGFLPAILYGHGKESVSLSISTRAMDGLLRHGAKLVELTGDVKDSALISTIQWDAFGHDVLHVDLVRVSADEQIEVEVPVTTRGIAPGAGDGGIVEILAHEITISCRANQIPEHIEININELKLDETITADQLELPEGATVIVPGEQEPHELVVVQCVLPPEELEEEDGETTSAEPELVGRKEDSEEGEGATDED